MSKKDFFILIIKLFGLYAVITAIFSGLPGSIVLVLDNIDLFGVIWIIIAVAVLIGLFVWLIFKADKVVRLFKLEKGFDDDSIEIGSLSAVAIVKLATFILGGLLIINNIPVFLSNSFFLFRENVLDLIIHNSSKYYWAVSAIKIAIGFLLITNFKFIATLFQAKENRKHP